MASFTERYVTVSGAGSNDGTSEANAWSWSQMIANVATDFTNLAGVGSIRVNVKSGSYGSIGATTLIGGAAMRPLVYRGYSSSIGDLDAQGRNPDGSLNVTNFPTITVTASWTPAAHIVLQNINFSGSVNGELILSSAVDNCILIQIKMVNSANNASASCLRLDDSIVLIMCDFECSGASHTTVVNTDVHARYIDCRFKGVASAALVSPNDGPIINRCLFIGSSVTGTGISITSPGAFPISIFNCTFYNLDTCMLFSNDAPTACAYVMFNNHATDCTKYIENLYTTQDLAIFEITNRTRDIGTLLTGVLTNASSGNITTDTGGAETDYTDAASGNFNLISGAGALLYGTSQTPLLSLPPVSSTQVLHGGATPSWASVSLTADVSGILPGGNGGTNNAFMQFSGPTTSIKTYTLPDTSTTILTTAATVTVAQGGTGRATLTANNVLLGNVTSPVGLVAPSTSGNVLTSNGTTWISQAPATASMSIGATVTSGTAGSVLFVGSGPVLSQNNTNFYWDNTVNANYLRLGSGTAAGEIRLTQNSGGNYVSLKAPASLASSTPYILPNAYPVGSGYVLSSDVSGNLSWIAGSGVSFDLITTGVNVSGQIMTVQDPSRMYFYPLSMQFYNSGGSLTYNLSSGTTSSAYNYTQQFTVGDQCIQIAHGRYTPATLSANATKYSIGFHENYIKIAGDTGDPPRRLQGMDYNFAGRRVYIRNAGEYDILVCHESSSAYSAAKRIVTPYGVDLLMRPKDEFTFMWDDEAGGDGLGRWLLVNGHDTVVEDPMCVAKMYEEFWGGITTSGSIGNTGYLLQASGGSVLQNVSGTSTDEQGWVQIQTGTGTTGYATLHYNAATQKTSNILNGTIWECLIRLPTIADGTNDYKVILGTSDSNTTFGSTNAFIGFIYDRATYGDYWYMRCHDGSTTTDVVTNIAVDTNWISLKWILSSDRTKVSFYINNGFIYDITTSIPLATTRVHPSILGIFKTAGTSTRYVDIEMTKLMVFYQNRRLITPSSAGIEKGAGGRSSYPGANPPAPVIEW